MSTFVLVRFEYETATPAVLLGSAVGEWLLARDNAMLQSDVAIVPHAAAKPLLQVFIERVSEIAIASLDKTIDGTFLT